MPQPVYNTNWQAEQAASRVTNTGSTFEEMGLPDTVNNRRMFAAAQQEQIDLSNRNLLVQGEIRTGVSRLV